MSEPTRWLDGEGPPGVRALLHAGLEERPSRQSLQRTIVAVSATALTSTAMGGALGATTQVAGSSAVGFIVKCAAIGVASASVMLGTAVGVQQYRAKSAAHPPAAVAQRTNAKPRAAAPKLVTGSVSTAALAESPALVEPPAEPKAEPAPVVAVSTSRPRQLDASESPSSVQPVPTAMPDLALTEELAFIDVARVRLRSGDASGALQRINEYERHSGYGRFAPEALYLRMQAQLQLGNRRAAAAAAREIVARYPSGPQVQRATAILRELGETKETEQ